MPAQQEAVVAEALLYLMGHPTKAVRWRAVHAVRRLSRYGQQDVLEYELEKQNQRHCGAFQHPTYIFYWLSAKLWFWASPDRIAVDNPQLTLLHKAQLIEELDQPHGHVLIQFFVRRIGSRLLDASPDRFTDSEQQLIQNALISNVSAPDEARAGGVRTQALAFPFDGLDTLPYWYKPLGNLFGLSYHHVARLAGDVIRDDFGYVGDARADNNVRPGEYYETMNWHGEVPAIEDLSTYFEFHAMFYAAGKLLKELPLADDERAYRTWDNWVAEWSTYWPTRWQSELLDPAPNSDLFALPSTSDTVDEWLATNLAPLARNIVLTTSEPVGASLTVYAHWTNESDNLEEEVTLFSEMVSAKTAPALLRALHSVDNHHDYAIPLEDSDHDYDDPDFTLTGFVRVVDSENHKALDKHDEFAGKLPDRYARLGAAFTAWSGAVLSDDFRYMTSQSGAIALFENWSDGVEKTRYRQVGNVVMRLVVNKDLLCRYLAEHDLCLLIECQIERERKPKEYGLEDYERVKPTLFLVHTDGVISTLPARSRPGTGQPIS